MKTQSTLFTGTVFATAVLALLTACGGDSGPSPTSGTAAVLIGAGNQSAVARATVAGGFSVARAQVSDASGRSTALSAGRVAAPAGTGVLHIAVRTGLASLFNQRRAIASADAHARAVVSSTDSCEGGGTVATSFDDHDNNSQPSAGDVGTLTYAQCVEGGATLDGTMVVTITSVPAGNTQLSGTAVFQHLKVTDGSTAATINGSASVSEIDTDTESDLTFIVGAGGLTVAASSPTYTDSITYSAGMTIATRDQTALGQSSVTLDGSFTVNSLDGLLTLATLQPIVQRDADDYPSAGQVRVTGASGSALLITVANATQVELALDANGDGTYEGDTFVNWTTLLPQ